MKQILIILIILIVAISSMNGCITSDDRYVKINILGETNAPNGVYDPAIEYDSNGVGWMAYSAVDAPEYVHTHLARSIDNGKTWTHQMRINEAINDTITLDNGSSLQGVWRHEVPTLVHDANDQNREWKLFWHRYFTIAPFETEQRLFQYGWIAYRHPPDPLGPWSEEIALFGSGSFPLDPFKTYIDLSGIHEDLSKFVVYSEPGSIVVDDKIYLSINGHYIDNNENIGKTILIRSSDHGNSWEYVNTLLEPEDVIEYNGVFFTGSSIVEEKNRFFLFACPENPYKQFSHFGTCIFEFEDITNGTLRTDETGHTILHKYLPPGKKSGGQSDYDEQNTYGGIIMPQHNYSALPEFFQIYNTMEKII